MAQFYTNFNDTLGTQPQGWTETWYPENSTWTVTESGGERFVRNNITSAQDHLLAWTDVGSVANVEVLTKFRTSQNGQYENTIFIRSSASSSNKTAYYASLNIPASQVKLLNIEQWYNNTYYPWHGNEFNWQPNTWYKMRWRAIGSEHWIKIWDASTAEPGWLWYYNDTTGTAYNGAGYVAIAGYTAGGNRDWDFVSVGTNGDTALEYAVTSKPQTGAFSVQVPTFSNGYQYRKKITANTSQLTGTSFTGFVMSVNITDADLKSVANGGNVINGTGNQDILFTDSSGTALPMAIEHYDPVTGQLVAWVKTSMGSNVSAEDSRSLYMYYGKASMPTSNSAPHTVYAGYNFALWMNGGGTGVEWNRTQADTWGPEATDASANGGSYTANKHGRGRFLGTGSIYKLWEEKYMIRRGKTIAFWFKFNSFPAANTYAPFYQIGGSAALRLDNNGGTLQWNLVKYGIIDQYITWSGAQTGVWYHITCVIDTTQTRMYINGTYIGAYNNSSETNNSTANPYIGYPSGTAQVRPNGDVDTFNMVPSVRTADAILVEYRNQNSSSTFWTIGAEEVSVTLNTKTQAGNFSVRADTTQSQNGYFRVKTTSDKSQSGLLRVKTTADKNQSGLFRLHKDIPVGQLGVFRVQVEDAKTQVGLFRIRTNNDKSQVGSFRIASEPSRLQLGIFRVTAKSDREQQGTFRVSLPVIREQLGRFRTSISLSQHQPGIFRIGVFSSKNISGIFSVKKTSDRSLGGIFRVQVTLAKYQTGKFRTRITSDKPQTGSFVTEYQGNKHQLGKFRIYDRNTLPEVFVETDLYKKSSGTVGDIAESDIINEGQYKPSRTEVQSFEASGIDEEGIYR